MTPLKKAKAKLVIAVMIDLIDFTAGRVIGFGTAFDVLSTAFAVALFGWKGLIQAWEVVEVTDQIDGFVPTLTLLALAELRAARKAERELDDDEGEVIEGTAEEV
jgi:hypothetical protein